MNKHSQEEKNQSQFWQETCYSNLTSRNCVYMFTSEIVCLLASQFTMKSQTMQVSGMFSVVNGTITTNQYSDPTKGRQKPAEFYQMKISFKSSNKYSRVWYLGIACKAFDVSRLRNHCSRWHWCKNLFIHPNERQCRI